jgi:hypothetical protein
MDCRDSRTSRILVGSAVVAALVALVVEGSSVFVFSSLLLLPPNEDTKSGIG